MGRWSPPLFQGIACPPFTRPLSSPTRRSQPPAKWSNRCGEPSGGAEQRREERMIINFGSGSILVASCGAHHPPDTQLDMGAAAKIRCRKRTNTNTVPWSKTKADGMGAGPRASSEVVQQERRYPPLLSIVQDLDRFPTHLLPSVHEEEETPLSSGSRCPPLLQPQPTSPPVWRTYSGVPTHLPMREETHLLTRG